ncbi:MAG TPA: autotransporter-associated beta strand repeat-containing protein [Verrucomicrobiae bacterium]|nr:autotransporter-associated beta strand repeat-containing protein [Verrucomicrobiae bacterium]
MKAKLALIALAGLSLLWPKASAHAALREWDGDASMDNKWTTSVNWAGNIAPNPGDSLLFMSGQRHPNNNNDFPDGTTFDSIEFRGGGGAGYNVSGNTIALNAGLRVENNSGNSIDHTVNNSLLLNSNQTFTVLNPVGTIFLPGTINLNGKGLRFDVSSASEARAQGVISGTGGVLKTGAGLLTLTANNTYTGATALSAGTLQINGSQPASPVVLGAGALKGIGTVGTLTAVGNGGPGSILLSPGGSPGILTCSNVALKASTTLAVELNGTTPGGSYDQLSVNGSVALNNAVLSVTLGFTPALGDSFTIINNDGVDAVAGRFSGLPQGATFVVGTTQFQINYAGGNGNDVVLTRIVALEIERVSTNAVRLLWPTNDTAAFNLECNTNLATVNWVLASPPPTVVGTKKVVTNTFPPTQKIYRLHKP